MPPLTAEQLAAVEALKQRVTSRAAANLASRQLLGFLGQFLVDSENQLIALMNGTAPPAGGAIEFGMVLYWIDNDLPDDWFFNWLKRQFPRTQITQQMYSNWQTTWQTTGVIAPDGTMVADGPFSQLDKGWLYASVLYVLWLYEEVPNAPIGQATPQIITLPNNPTLTVVLIGDWGSGSWDDCGTQGPATAIMQQVQALKPRPDIVIHLGDVYYAGTGHLSLAVNVLMILLSGKTGRTYLPDEDTVRLVQRWWNPNPPQSFTLNSNHEMYSGANGYYYDALGTALFAAQKNSSYFALYYQDWAILGLDSAFYSNAFFNMQGALQNPSDSTQVTWVQGLDLKGKKVIALTHHTALKVDGLPISGNQLYNDMHAALNNQDPDYWYWGHIHNGVVYNSNATMSSTGKTKTLCRCVGHAALPFGNAYYWKDGTRYNLGQSKCVDYYAHTPLSKPPKCPQWTYRVKNGFAVFTLSKGAIQEAFYEQGNTTPVWTSMPRKLKKKKVKAKRAYK